MGKRGREKVNAHGFHLHPHIEHMEVIVALITCTILVGGIFQEF